MYICPVCGYDKLREPPENWEICPCCVTMFGYSDISWGCDLLRNEWIENGMLWNQGRMYSEPMPENYDPIKQLLNIGVIL